MNHPPRYPSEQDADRYQTVYAERPGAVAAPTAGLHFDDELLVALDDRGIERSRVTLHVGAGTFQPVRVENIEEHRMHAEYLEVPALTCDAVQRTKERGGRVIAVGTTAVRALESAAQGGELRPFSGDSSIFRKTAWSKEILIFMPDKFTLTEWSRVTPIYGAERL